MTRIDALTPAQEARLPEWRDRWIKIGLSTEPADRPTAEAALRAMYGYAGLKPPEILWASSPEEMAKLLAGLDTGPAVQAAVESAVWSALWLAVGLAVGSAVGLAVRSAVGSVGSAVWSAVEAAVEAAVGPAVGSAYDGGQTWVAWPAVESYCREVCGLVLPGDLSARGKALADYRSSVGPGLWFERIAILCERPASFGPLTWRTVEDPLRRTAQSLLDLYDAGRTASDGAEADAAWTELRRILGGDL